MRKRKTIDVVKVKEYVNMQLAREDYPQDKKDALSGLLETVLFETGNYRGFMYPVWNHEDYSAHVEAVNAGDKKYSEDFPTTCDRATRHYL